jgi:hypothetical protein
MAEQAKMAEQTKMAELTKMAVGIGTVTVATVKFKGTKFDVRKSSKCSPLCPEELARKDRVVVLNTGADQAKMDELSKMADRYRYSSTGRHGQIK